MNMLSFVMKYDTKEFAKFIDHTVIKPDTDIDTIVKNLDKWLSMNFATIALSPYHAERVLRMRRDIPICVVIGFPMGYEPTDIKVSLAKKMLELGAREIDMVMNIQAFKERNYRYVVNDIASVAEVVRSYGAVLKVIIETGLLSDEEKIIATQLVAKGKAQFVKTCTGFLGGRATVHDVRLLKSVAENLGIKVKASGGIRHAEDAITMIEAGADRIGTSTGDKIVEEYKALRNSVVGRQT